MIFLKGFGLIDFLAAIVIMALYYEIFSPSLGRTIGLFFGIYLIVKMFAFRFDMASRIDFLVGVYLVVSVIFGFQTWLSIVSSLWLFQKVVFSYL